MEDPEIHYRNILLYQFRAGNTAVEARREICAVYGEEAVSEAMSKKWFKQFKDGNFNLEDTPPPSKRSKTSKD